MGKRVEKPEAKPITAQPPADAEGFTTLVPRATSDGPTTSRVSSTPGCYRVMPKKPAP
jgi:hypothetical protein